ncbi:MAG: UDP-glucose 4-epimerase GalE [Acidobacteriota bacterium]
MKVLVTGAAGYIGAHVWHAIEEAGHETVLLDNLSTGWEGNLRGRDCHRVDLDDGPAVRKALEGCDAVAHLAGAALVPESVTKPEKYWRNNLGHGLSLVEAMLDVGVSSFVFSSTCATYGFPETVPISEDTPQNPITPYGTSKLAFERVLADVASAHDFKPVVFRYFNAAGAHENGIIGEVHDPETHLIPIVLQVATGERESVTIYGDDYDTPDGTCIRDYIDVRDIARAHVLALEGLAAGRFAGETFNLGHGLGLSVREVIECCRKVTGHPIPAMDGERRPGDPDRLTAQADRARDVLGWVPEHDLEAMVKGAWAFAQSQAKA